MDVAYEERYGLNRSSLVNVLCCLVGLATAFVPTVPTWLRVVVVVFCGFGGVVLLVTAMSRRTAPRVDERGVTLGTAGPWAWQAAVLIPWQDVVDVVLWRQHAVFAKVDYVGVARRPGAPPLPHSDGRWQRTNAAVVPHVPADIVAASRAFSGWSLNLDRLRESVARFAPTARVVDIRQPGRT